MKKYIFLFLVIISVFSLISYSTKKENNLDDTFSNTGFEIVNTTKDSVLMYLTINAPSDSTWVQSVDDIFGINSSQLQGSVIVANQFFPSSKLCSVCGIKNKNLKLSQRTCICENGHKLDRDLNASINLEKLAMSSIVSAFGDKSSVGVNPIQLVDELGIKHQMFTFV